MRILFFSAVMAAALIFGMTTTNIPTNVFAQETKFESLPKERRDQIIDIHGEILKKAYQVSTFAENQKFDKMNEEIAAILRLFETLPTDDRVFVLKNITDILASFPATSSENYGRFFDLLPPDKTMGYDLAAGRKGIMIAHARAILITQGDTDKAFDVLEKHLKQPIDCVEAAIFLWDEINKAAQNEKWLATQLPETRDFKSLVDSCANKIVEYYDLCHKATGRQKPSKERLEAAFISTLAMLRQSKQFDKAVDFAEKYMGESHVETCANVVPLYMNQNQYDKAEQLAKKILLSKPSAKSEVFWYLRGVVSACQNKKDLAKWSVEIRRLIDENMDEYVMPSSSRDFETPLISLCAYLISPMVSFQSVGELLPVVIVLVDDLQATPHEKGMIVANILGCYRSKKGMAIEEMKTLAKNQRDVLEKIELRSDTGILLLLHYTYVPEDILEKNIDTFLQNYDSMQLTPDQKKQFGSSDVALTAYREGAIRQISWLGRPEKIKPFVFDLDETRDDKWRLLALFVTSHFYPRQVSLEDETPQICAANETQLKESIVDCMNLIGTIKERAKREQAVKEFCGQLFVGFKELESLSVDQRKLYFQNLGMSRRIMLDNLGDAEGWSPQDKTQTRMFLFEVEKVLSHL